MIDRFLYFLQAVVYLFIFVKKISSAAAESFFSSSTKKTFSLDPINTLVIKTIILFFRISLIWSLERLMITIIFVRQTFIKFSFENKFMLTFYFVLILFFLYVLVSNKNEKFQEIMKIKYFLLAGFVLIDMIFYFGMPALLNYVSAKQTFYQYDLSGNVNATLEYTYIPSENDEYVPQNSSIFSKTPYANITLREIVTYLAGQTYIYAYTSTYMLPIGFSIGVFGLAIILIRFVLSLYQQRIGLKE